MKHISERERFKVKSFINLTVAVFVLKQILWTLRTWAQHSPSPCCSNQHRHYHLFLFPTSFRIFVQSLPIKRNMSTLFYTIKSIILFLSLWGGIGNQPAAGNAPRWTKEAPRLLPPSLRGVCSGSLCWAPSPIHILSPPPTTSPTTSYRPPDSLLKSFICLWCLCVKRMM